MQHIGRISNSVKCLMVLEMTGHMHTLMQLLYMYMTIKEHILNKVLFVPSASESSDQK